MRTYARMVSSLPVRTSLRAVCISIAALTTVGVVVPLAGCGSGGGALRSVSGTSVTRQKGTLSLTVAWPARTRLIPDAANSIQVKITRQPDADIASPKDVPAILLTRPETIDGSGTSTANFTGLELGKYDITIVAYPAKTGPGAVVPGTGENVPVARTIGTQTVGAGNNSVTLTMDSTIATLVPALDATFPRDTAGNLILRPGQQVKFNINAFDNTPPTATPPGPYRVLFSASKLKYEVTGQVGVTVTVGNNPNDAATFGLVTAGNLTDATTGGTANIKVTDQESGKSSTIKILVSPAGLSRVAQWARFHGDSQNTGQITDANVPVLDPNLRGADAGLSWPLITGSQIEFSSPTIAADGTVFIGTITKDNGGSDGDKKLYAIKPDGTLKWTFSEDVDGTPIGDIESSATIAQDGTIFFASTTGTVYAVKDIPDPLKGTPYTLVWKIKVGGPVWGSIAISKDNTIYVATTEPDGKVYAFSGYTGQPIKAKQPDGTFKDWVYAVPQSDAANPVGIYGAPALSLDSEQSTLLVTTNQDGIVYAIGTGRGATFGANRIWRVNLNAGPIQASPVVTRIGTVESVVVATLGGRVFSLRKDSGATTEGWPAAGYDAGAPIFTTPAVLEDTPTSLETKSAKFIYVGTFDNTSGTDDHKVVALNAADGTQAWRTPIGLFANGFTSSPALSGDGTYLFIGNYDGSLYAIDTTDDGLTEHGLAKFTNTDGNDKDWKFATPSSDSSQPTNNLDSSPAIDKNGHVYIGGYDGSIYSVGVKKAKP